MFRLLIAVYLIEAGLVLTIAPWTVFWWERNYFGHVWPWAGALMASPFVRGGVTGVGLITVVAGLADLAVRISRGASPGDPPGDGPPAT